jgi:hypothetical protein
MMKKTNNQFGVCMKTLEKTYDGRVIVKREAVKKKEKISYPHFPESFFMIEAYDER